MRYGNPGDTLTRENRFAQMLAEQDAQAGVPSNLTGGLAHMLRQGLQGFMMGRDEKNMSEADAAMLRGATPYEVKKPVTDEDSEETGYMPEMTEGGVAGMQRELGKLPPGNRYAGTKLKDLLLMKAADDKAAGLRKEKYDREDKQFKQKLGIEQRRRATDELRKQEAAKLAHERNMRMKAAPGWVKPDIPVPGRDVPLPPAVQAQKLAQKAKGTPPGPEKEYSKTKGKNLADSEFEIQKAGEAAVKTNSYLNMAKIFVNDPRNTASEFGAMVGKTAQSLGIPMPQGFESRVTNATSFEAMMGNILAQKLAQQKGPQTDRDATRMAQTLATLKNTPAAKEFLIDAARALNNRDIGKAEFYRKHIKANGNSLGADVAWNDSIKNMPLFGVNGVTNMPVFYDGFMKNNMQANPTMSEEQVRQEWKRRYGQ